MGLPEAARKAVFRLKKPCRDQELKARVGHQHGRYYSIYNEKRPEIVPRAFDIQA